MTDLEKLKELLSQNRMDKAHEKYGFPEGWNAALDFVEQLIVKQQSETKA